MENRSILENYRQLKYSQKKGDSTPLYTRYVNRNLGQLFAALLAYLNISPNAITYISGIFTFGAYASFLLIQNIAFPTSLILYIILVVGFALDSADGLVSRLLNKQSAQGEWLDHTFDAIKAPLGHGVAFILINNSMNLGVKEQLVLIAILVAASSLFLSNILKDKLFYIQRLKESKPKATENLSSTKSNIKSVLTLPLDYGVFMLMFLLVPYPELFFKVYFIWGMFFVAFTLLSFIKSGKQLRNI